MSDEIKATDEKGPKIARYFTAGAATITVKDAAGDPTEVTNPDFRFYRGIPARDLAEDEYEALTDEQKAQVDEGHVTETRDTGRKKAGVPVLEEIRAKLYQRTKPAGRKE